MSKRLLAAVTREKPVTAVAAPPVPASCGSCAHFHRERAEEFKGTLRAPCRRYPPVGHVPDSFPQTRADSLCGEFRHG